MASGDWSKTATRHDPALMEDTISIPSGAQNSILSGPVGVSSVRYSQDGY